MPPYLEKLLKDERLKKMINVLRKSWVRETIITILIALVLFAAIRSVAHTSIVRGISMEPNLEDGQRVVVSKIAYWFDDPARGDIVVFDTPRHGHDVIHRIVGLPGEKLEIKDGELYIDGDRMEESYLPQKLPLNVPLQEIPEDHYFIIGDNRTSSAWDIVPEGDIIGKAWLCYWPFSKWERIASYPW